MRAPTHSRRGQAGFTLIELMVGTLLALMTTVIIAEVLIKSEGNKRTTSEGADAQTNGALALYAIQREVQMAGYGLISDGRVLGCEIRAKYGSNTAHSFTLAPVVIGSSGANNVSDTVTVLRSGSNGYVVPLSVDADHAAAATAFTATSTLGVKAGDLMLAMPATVSANQWCTVFEVTNESSSPIDNTTIPHEAKSDSWNQATSIMPSAGYVKGSTLIRLNPLVYNQYAISNNNLVANSLISSTDNATVETVGTEIVLLKAYYGKDTSGDGAVDAYSSVTPTTKDGWLQVKTIRLALLARSTQREKDVVTTTDPTWDVGKTVTVSGSVACGSSKCLTLKVSPATGSDAEWKHYRYKVFDTVIPLRNMMWASVS